MKSIQTIGRFGAAALAAASFLAFGEGTNSVTASPQQQGVVSSADIVAAARAAAEKSTQVEASKTIKVVGLEDDKDNAVVTAPPELGAKPNVASAEAKPSEAAAPAQPAEAAPVLPTARQTVVDAVAANYDKKTPLTASIDADALVDTAKAKTAEDAASRVNTAHVKSLTLEGMVIPPSSDRAKTLEEAIRNILIQAGKQVGTVSSNGIDKLTMPYQQLGDGKSYEIEWRKALRLLLGPVGYNFTEDTELVLFGLAAEVDVKHKQLAQERLASNRTPILFTTNEAEGGMELRNAIRDISVKADVTITTDYMEPADLYVPAQTAIAEGKMSAEEIGKAKAKAAAQQAAVKRTTFDTNGQQIEWRIVLREILNPHGYDFVEVGGVVRIAKRAKLAEWEKEAVAAKPLTAKIIRLYHADPEEVVTRVMKIKGILVHPNALLQATRKKDDSTDTVKNLNSRIQTSSGQQSGMSDTTSQVFDKLVRPRTVPAIVAYDVEENIPNIEEKIKLFDIKEKQILIEAILFQLDMNNGNGDMDGIKWEIANDDGELTGSFVPLFGSFGNVANASETFADLLEKGGSDWYSDSKAWVRTQGLDFKATIQLIRKQKNSKVLASPMLVVGDHSQAAIQVSDVEPIPQIDSSTVTGTSTVHDNMNIQWNMVRSGVLMWVQPEITESGSSVRLTVHPQVVTKGEQKDLSQLGGIFTAYPVYNYELKMHEMDTRATVPTGATLMFGGLIDNVEEEEEEKVRWLGDLPLIGWLFRSTTKKKVQKNLIIMIRPTILEDGDQTGFETNALQEVDNYSANTGRDLRKTPNGPHSFQKTGENIKEYLDERLVKPFRGEDMNQGPNKQRFLPVDAESLPRPSPVDAESLPRPSPVDAESLPRPQDDKQSFLTEGHPAPVDAKSVRVP